MRARTLLAVLCKSIANVARHVKRVGDEMCPRPTFVFSPLTKRIDDVATGFEQSIGHGAVASERDGAVAVSVLIVAVFILEVVDVPVGKGLSVDLFAIETRWVVLAGEETGGGCNLRHSS